MSPGAARYRMFAAVPGAKPMNAIRGILVAVYMGAGPASYARRGTKGWMRHGLDFRQAVFSKRLCG